MKRIQKFIKTSLVAAGLYLFPHPFGSSQDTANRVSASSEEALPEGITRAKNPITQNHYNATDPFNVAPAIEVIWRTVKIENEIALKAGKKMVILFSEAHMMPTHRMIQIGLIQKLEADRKENAQNTFMITSENEYNVTDLHYPGLRPKNDLGMTDPRMLPYGLSSSYLNAFGPASSTLRFVHSYYSGSPFFAVDAGRNLDFSLNLKDPVNLQYAGDLIRTLNSENPVSSELKLKIRDRVTAGLITKLMNETSSQIVLHTCGLGHVFGYDASTREKHPYEDSLSAQFTEAGKHVLVIMIDNKNIKLLNKKGVQEHPKTILISGVDQTEFSFKDNTYEEEIEYIKKLRAAFIPAAECPFDVIFFNLDEVLKTEAEMIKSLRAGQIPKLNHSSLQ